MNEPKENPLFHKPLSGTMSESLHSPGSGDKQVSHRPDFLEPENPLERQDKSLLGNDSQISVYKLKKSLEKDPVIRRDIARKLSKKPYSPEVDAAIKEMEAEIPKNITADGFISHRELKSMYDVSHHGSKEYWEEKHEIREMSKGGITKAETWKFERHKEIKDFLKNLLGFGKK